jgi:peptidoglycan hydrolase CwlO-like protein
MIQLYLIIGLVVSAIIGIGAFVVDYNALKSSNEAYKQNTIIQKSTIDKLNLSLNDLKSQQASNDKLIKDRQTAINQLNYELSKQKQQIKDTHETVWLDTPIPTPVIDVLLEHTNTDTTSSNKGNSTN